MSSGRSYAPSCRLKSQSEGVRMKIIEESSMGSYGSCERERPGATCPNAMDHMEPFPAAFTGGNKPGSGNGSCKSCNNKPMPGGTSTGKCIASMAR